MAVELTLSIGGKAVRMRASALTPRLYRARFGRDLMADMRALQYAAGRMQDLPKDATPEQRAGAEFTADELTIFENVAYVMVKHADDSVPDSPEDWLDSIDGVFAIYHVLPAILRLWNLNRQTTSVPKKK